MLELDKQIFLAINEANNAFLDVLMYWWSDKYIWIPMYLFLLVLVFSKYKLKSLFVIVAIAALITLSDQISVHLFKNVFERLRPCHEPDLQGMIHLVNGHCGGQFGFISSHASNTMALAVFLSLLLGTKYRFLYWLLPLWALITSYSRIYLGVHYPGDVIGGMIVGGLLGLIIYLILKRIIR